MLLSQKTDAIQHGLRASVGNFEPTREILVFFLESFRAFGRWCFALHRRLIRFELSLGLKCALPEGRELLDESVDKLVEVLECGGVRVLHEDKFGSGGACRQSQIDRNYNKSF